MVFKRDGNCSLTLHQISRMSRFIPIFLFSTVILLLVEVYVFRGLKILIQPIENGVLKRTIKWLYWSGTIAYVAYFIWTMYYSKESESNHVSRHYFNLFGFYVLLLVPQLVIVVFQLMEDISFASSWLWNKINFSSNSVSEGVKISRGVFLSRIGIFLAAIPFTGILYGLVKGKYDFRIVREKLIFPSLPSRFNGLTMVQISDAHLGSFSDNTEPIQKAIDMINGLQPDIVVFTGDLVNNYAEEAEMWIPLFKQIKARYGKYSILGNHDYGDYGRFASPAEKVNNLARLKDIHGEMGFSLLLNEHKLISRNEESIAIIGVENWGKPPFPQYGNLEQASNNITHIPFKILLSHDPSHWDAQVLGKKDINLTLSGHTHGMQFGIEIAGIKWSPVKYKYPRWGGLYKENNQLLYVNRGFGYLGFPGRVGMPPEITFFEFRNSA